MHVCKNCGHNFEKNYCNACGQKIAHRLDVGHVWHEVFHVFTHTDKGILAFIPKIVMKPGIVALDYVEGRRKLHFNIFQYLVLVVGLVTFLMSKTDYMDSVFQSMRGDSVGNGRAAMFAKKANEFTQRYFNFISFAFIPVYAFFTWLFFKKRGYNYAEAVVLQTCLQGQSNTLTLFVFLPVIYLLPGNLHGTISIFSSLIMLIGQALGYRHFFKVTWLKAVIASLIVYAGFTIVMVIVTALAGLSFALST